MNEIIRVDGTREACPPADSKHYTLEELQKALGFDKLDILETTDGRLMVVKILKGLPVNPAASALYRNGDWNPVTGDVLVCHHHNFK